MNNKGFGLVSVLAVFLVLTVLIASLMTLSKVQSLQAVNNTVEDQLELTAQNAIDMVVVAIIETEASGDNGALAKMVPATLDQSYNLDIDLDDDSHGTISNAQITRTLKNVAIISLTVSKGKLDYDLKGVMIRANFRWEFQNYAK